MRVLLVQGRLMAEQMAHWEAAGRLGVDLHVACAPAANGEAQQTNLEMHMFKPRGLVRRGHLWWWYPGLGALVDSLQPDVVHVTAETYGVFFSQLDLRRQRVVGHAVDNILVHGSALERTIRLRRASRILKRLDGLASWNRAGLELGYRFGLRPDVPTVIVPGRIAAPDPFLHAGAARQAHRQRLGIGSEVVVGFLGRLVPEKGVDWLLESYAAASRGDSSLHVYGSGRAEDELAQLAGTLGVPARFGGGVAAGDVPGVLASFDMLVVPSVATRDWAEQFGRVIVEAMFAGVPVIASRSGSIPEVVGNAAILVDEGDRAGLTAAIESLAGDAERRASLGAAGRSWALLSYSPETLATEVVSFWKAVLARPH